MMQGNDSIVSSRPDLKGHRLEKALKYGLCGAPKAAGTPFGTPKMQNYLVLFGYI